MTTSEVKEIKSDKSTKKVVDSGMDVAQIQKFGDACLRRIIDERLDEIYADTHDFGTESDILFIFEDDIRQELSDYFLLCFNLSAFENMGYDFNYSGTPSESFSINFFDLTASMDYTVLATYRDSSGFIREFNTKLFDPFGLLINSTQLILNDLSLGGTYNISDRCTDYTAENTVNITTNGYKFNVTHVAKNKGLSIELSTIPLTGVCSEFSS